MLYQILSLLRVKHYIKNLIIFLPYLFFLKEHNFVVLNKLFILFIAFSLVSSAVYIFNDICDIERDKTHPYKKNLPITSGRIHLSTAINILLILLILAFSISIVLNNKILLIFFIYLILNIFYSLYLKNKKFVNIMCIVLGFILRVFASFIILKQTPNLEFLFFIMFVSVFFIICKKNLNIYVQNEANKL